MVAEELVIKLRATAEGIKQGVNVAKAELSKLRDEQEKLKAEIKFKINSEDVKKLKAELAELEKQKQELQHEIKFTSDSEGVKKLKTELEEVIAEKKMLETDLKMHMSLEDAMAAEEELIRLTQEKERLEGEIKLSIKADTEAAKKALADTEQNIARVNRDIQIKMEASGVNELKSQLQNVTEEIQDASKASAEFDKNINKAAMAGAAAFGAMVLSIKSGLETFNEYTATMEGFASQMDYLGINMAEAMETLQEKSQNGLISPAEVAASIKNLTAYGLSLDKASKLVDRLTDSAAYNRQAHYSLGEAVKVTTEGIKNENSVLADASGVPKNLSIMMREYADSLGKTTDALTSAERAQAVYNGFMTETEGTVGNAQQYMESLGGSQAQLSASTENLAKAYGEAWAPAIKDVTDALIPLVNGVTKYINANKNTAVSVTGLIGAFGGLVAAVYAINKAYTAYKSVLVVVNALEKGSGILGLISLLIAGGTIAKALFDDFRAKLEEADQAQRKLNASALSFKTIMGEGADETNVEQLTEYAHKLEELGGQIDTTLSEARERYQELQDTMANVTTEEMVAKHDAVREIIKEVNAEFEAMGLTLQITEGDLSLYNNRIDETITFLKTAAAVGKVNADTTETIAVKIAEEAKSLEKVKEKVSEYMKETGKLSSIYDTLYKKQDLSIDQLNQLIMTYPSVAKHIAENGYEREALIEVIKAEIDESKKAMIQELENKKKTLEASQEKYLKLQEFYTGDTENHNSELAAKKEGLADYVNAVEQSIRDIENANASTVATGAVAAAGAKAVEDAYDAVYEKKKKQWEGQKEQFEKEKQELEEVNNIIASLNKIPETTAKPSGGSKSQAKKEENEELKKAMEKYQHLQRLDRFESLEAEKQYLDEKVAIHAKSQEEIWNIEERQHELESKMRKEAEEEWKKDFAKAERTVDRNSRKKRTLEDYENIINAYKALTEGLDKESDDYVKLTEKIEDATEDMLNEVARLRKKSYDDQIDAETRHMEKLKAMNGLKYGPGEDDVFKVTEEDEIASYKRKIDSNQAYIDELKAKGEQITNNEKDLLEELEKQQTGYYEKIEDLQIQSLQTRQKNYEETLKKLEKTEKDSIKEIESKYKELQSSIKDTYKARIEAAKEAANEEVAILQDKIKEIDKLLNKQSIDDADNIYEDKVNRLKQMLNFEKDESNRYELQKELDNLKAEYDKRKAREALQAEKDALSEQLNAIKNNASEEQKALEQARDMEISALEDRMEAEIKTIQQTTKDKIEALNKQHEVFMSYIASELSISQENAKELATVYEEDADAYKGELGNKEESSKIFYRESENRAKVNADKEKQIFARTTNEIINNLFNKVNEFAEAGRRAGEAYARNFKDAVSDIVEFSVGVQGYSASPYAAPMASNTSNIVNLNQNIYAKTVTPSQAAVQSRRALEQAVKYI